MMQEAADDAVIAVGERRVEKSPKYELHTLER
jgi:hypothetical protein